MNRYRLNTKFLIILLAAAMVGGVGVFFAWSFQIKRNAGSLLARAEEEIASDNLPEAARLYNSYLNILPDGEESDATRAKLSLTLLDLASRPESSPEDRSTAAFLVPANIREIPENDEVRTAFVEFAMSPGIRRWSDAERHLKKLIEHQPENADFKVDRLLCLIRTGAIEGDDGAIAYGYKLIGYDETSATFDSEAAEAGDRPPAYSRLAPLVRRYRIDEVLADKIIDQMVTVNPKMGDAYFERAQYARSLGRIEQAREDLAKAYELDPKNADILLVSAQFALIDKDLEKARRFLAEGIEVDASDYRCYDWFAQVEAQSGDMDAAFARIEEGIKAAEYTLPLYLLKARYEMSQSAAAVRTTKERMRKAGFNPIFLDFVEGQARIAEKKWVAAIEVFRKVRDTQLANDSTYGPMVDSYLGFCNYSLGKLDAALGYYRLALDVQPKNEQAKAMVGLLEGRLHRDQPGRGQSLNDIITSVKALPEDQQDWNKVNEFVEAEIEKMKAAATNSGREFDDVRAQLFRAEVLMARGAFEEARELIRNCDTKDMRIRLAAINLTARDPVHGPADALKLLAKTVNKFGDSPQLRQQKGILLMQLGGDGLADQIAQLTEGIEDWKPSDQVKIWQLAAQAYSQLRMPDRAQECLDTVLALAPNDLATRIRIFENARARFDDDAMVAAQKEILNVVGRESDETWQYSEAARLVTLFRAGRQDKSALDKASDLVQEALKERPEWHKLHLLRAEIAVGKGRLTEAVNAYDRAAELGVATTNDIKQHAQLLYARGRVKDARRVIERVLKPIRQRAFPQLSAEIMFNSGNVEEALETGDLLIAARPTDPNLRLWYGSLLQRASTLGQKETRVTKAGEMYQAAVEFGPSRYDTWTAWINHLGSNDRMEEAEQAIREAQLALPANALPIAMAKYSQMLGRWRDAEAYYRTAIDSDPTNIRRVRMLTEFFLSPSNPLPNRIVKAVPYLNQIVRAGHEGQIESTNEDLIWARQRIAFLLASSKDYPQLLRAEKSIEANAIDGELQTKDKLQLAQILSTRPEPESRKKAIQLLEEVNKAGNTLNAQGGVTLAKLYRQVGDWPNARARMLDTIGQHGGDPVVMAAFTEMLIARKDYRNADTRLKQLREIQPDHPMILTYSVQILAGQNKKEEAARLLIGLLQRKGGRNLANLTAEDLPLLEQVASMLVQIDDPQKAENLLRVHGGIAQKADQAAAGGGEKPRSSLTARSAMLLADHLGRYGNIEASLKILENMWESTKSPTVIGAALAVIRARRDELGETTDEMIDGWLADALRREPDSVTLQMHLADFRDIQRNFDEAETIYRRLLSRDDIGPRQRGIVLNNIAFLLALQEKDLDSAMRFVEEGRDLFGPTSDMLDTMAVVRIARKDAEGAVKDLELAIADNPTAAKYFHLTRAYLLTENKKHKAVQAWNNAIELGLDLDALNLLEHDEHARVEDEVERIRRDRNRI